MRSRERLAAVVPPSPHPLLGAPGLWSQWSLLPTRAWSLPLRQDAAQSVDFRKQSMQTAPLLDSYLPGPRLIQWGQIVTADFSRDAEVRLGGRGCVWRC